MTDGLDIAKLLRTFFVDLDSRLKMVRVLGSELDRNLAHRFNVLDYLKTDELGLSKIISDLLDPTANHGQDTLFLRELLKILSSLKDDPKWCPDLEGSEISVKRERKTETNRSIDISVHIRDRNGKSYCIAFENKPYAGDQENQITDYLIYLKKKYDEKFGNYIPV